MNMHVSGGRAERGTRAIALLAHRPSRELIDFYARFLPLGYEIFVVVDDNALRLQHPGIKFIQIDDDDCRKKGFLNFNPVVKKESRCSAWDKAIYYFCRIDTAHEHVW